ncbi:MAG: glycoside hydrolase family 43 protein [Dactylosporangium sp.]|nr:glycoside hydrolase family 43 protein [Dactylosporangium sp.]
MISAVAASVVVNDAPARAASTDSAYVMGYFTESPSGTGDNYGLHLAVSTDSRHWTPLNQNAPVATPTAGTGGLRDPFILRKTDGTFVVIATDLNGQNWSENNQYIHVWDSTDLRSFTNYRRLKMHSMTTHTWAPEAFYDASRGQYGIVYSAYNGIRDVIMVNYTTDFLTVGDPQVFFDPGFNVLDATMATSGSTNYLYFKRTSDSTLMGAKSSTLDPGSFNGGVYTGAYGSSIEGPIVVQSLSSGTWYLWGDNYSKQFRAWQTSDIDGGSWTAVNQVGYNQPLNSKHATIAPITSTEYANLVARWGSPSWNRVRSYNYPTRYVRHADYVGRIDAYPFDPYADSQWTLVPGLADSTAVSFQSVNYPTRYLRHYNYEVRLEVNDGTSTFAQDATFYPTSGLADSTKTSFRSYNNSTRYLRHYGYVLRIDPISTATEQQDATFMIEY